MTATGFDVIDAHQHYGSIDASMGGLEAAMPAKTAEELDDEAIVGGTLRRILGLR